MIHKGSHTVWLHLFNMYRLSRSLETESQSLAASNWVEYEANSNYMLSMDFLSEDGNAVELGRAIILQPSRRKTPFKYIRGKRREIQESSLRLWGYNYEYCTRVAVFNTQCPDVYELGILELASSQPLSWYALDWRLVLLYLGQVILFDHLRKDGHGIGPDKGDTCSDCQITLTFKFCIWMSQKSRGEELALNHGITGGGGTRQ